MLDLLLTLVLLANPVTFIPGAVIEAYGAALAWSEPLLLICEAVLLVNTFCSLSRYLVIQMDDHPIFSKVILAVRFYLRSKVLDILSFQMMILLVSAVAYTLSTRSFLASLMSATLLLKWWRILSFISQFLRSLFFDSGVVCLQHPVDGIGTTAGHIRLRRSHQ